MTRRSPRATLDIFPIVTLHRNGPSFGETQTPSTLPHPSQTSKSEGGRSTFYNRNLRLNAQRSFAWFYNFGSRASGAPKARSRQVRSLPSCRLNAARGVFTRALPPNVAIHALGSTLRLPATPPNRAFAHSRAAKAPLRLPRRNLRMWAEKDLGGALRPSTSCYARICVRTMRGTRSTGNSLASELASRGP